MNQGWTNHETWIAHMWIQNNETLYAIAILSVEHLASVLPHCVGFQAARDEIGDLSKVNWDEIKAFIKEQTK